MNGPKRQLRIVSSLTGWRVNNHSFGECDRCFRESPRWEVRLSHQTEERGEPLAMATHIADLFDWIQFTTRRRKRDTYIPWFSASHLSPKPWGSLLLSWNPLLSVCMMYVWSSLYRAQDMPFLHIYSHGWIQSSVTPSICLYLPNPHLSTMLSTYLFCIQSSPPYLLKAIKST